MIVDGIQTMYRWCHKRPLKLSHHHHHHHKCRCLSSYFFAADLCSENWVSFDTSCYTLMIGTDAAMSTSDGDDFCVGNLDAKLFVPNSKDESLFIGNYLASLDNSLVNWH